MPLHYRATTIGSADARPYLRRQALRPLLAAATITAALTLAPVALGQAMPPAAGDGATAGPDTQDVLTQAIESFTGSRGLRNLTEEARDARQRAAEQLPGMFMAAPVTGTAVRGTVDIPVIGLKYADTPADPIQLTTLQTELFDGPWETGTMTDFYKEMSRQKFTVGGQVYGWVQLSKPEANYVGPDDCDALCSDGHLGEMLLEALHEIDATVDFSAYDDDGVDDMPNSVDAEGNPEDDGYVDFIAFVHPTLGAECRRDGHVWSHRFSIKSLTGSDHETNDLNPRGVPIRIDNYVIMPAKACDNTSMIQIGVFAHEFGHAFGLPDLYDTGGEPNNSGLGGWDLMASGSWGGAGGGEPDSPAHMSAWSKEFLGWVTPKVVTDDGHVTLRPVLSSGDVARIDYATAADPADTRYVLIEYRKRTGFDRSLTGEGLLVTEVNNTRVTSGLIDNRVNADEADLGIDVIEADGRMDLDHGDNRADAGDLYRSAAAVFADSTGAEPIRAALCNLSFANGSFSFDVMTSQTTCPGNLLEAVVPTEDAEALPLGQEVVIQGTLANEGTNYFTDRKLVLTDANGKSVEVNVPVAIETPVVDGSKPVLSDFLGTDVVVRGTFTRELDIKGDLKSVFRANEIGSAQFK